MFPLCQGSNHLLRMLGPSKFYDSVSKHLLRVCGIKRDSTFVLLKPRGVFHAHCSAVTRIPSGPGAVVAATESCSLGSKLMISGLSRTGEVC